MVDKLPKKTISDNHIETNLVPLAIDLRKTRFIHTKDIKFVRVSSLNRKGSNNALKISKQLIIKKETSTQHLVDQQCPFDFNRLDVNKTASRVSGFIKKSSLEGYSVSSQKEVENIKKEVTQNSIHCSKLFILITKTKKQAHNSILKKLQSTYTLCQIKTIGNLIMGKKSHLKCERKEWTIYDNTSEYLRRYYTYTETLTRFSLLYQLYKKYCNMKPSCCILEQQLILIQNVYLKKQLLREKMNKKVSKGKNCNNILAPEFLKELEKDEEMDNSRDNELRNNLAGDAVYNFNNYNDYAVANKCDYEYLKSHPHKDTNISPKLIDKLGENEKGEHLLNVEISEIKPHTSVDNYDFNDYSIPSKLLLPELPNSKSTKKSRLISMRFPKYLVNYKSNKPSDHFHMRNSSGSMGCTDEKKDIEPLISADYVHPPLVAPVIRIECCRAPSDEGHDCDDIEMLCVKYGQGLTGCKSAQSLLKAPVSSANISQFRTSAEVIRGEFPEIKRNTVTTEGSKRPQICVRVIRSSSGTSERQLDRTLTCSDSERKVHSRLTFN